MVIADSMDINTQHVAHWGDVLRMVDDCVKSSKEKKISIKELNNDLREQDNTNHNLSQEKNITYLPSHSRSVDGQLLKLKKKDPLAYEHVIRGKMKINDAY